MGNDHYSSVQQTDLPNVGFSGLSCRRLMQADFRDANIIFEIRDNIISQGPHYHVMFELFAVMQGKLELRIEGKSICLSEGDLCIIPPWKCHQAFETVQPSAFLSIMFIVEGAEPACSFQRLLLNATAMESTPYQMRGQTEIIGYLKKMMDKSLQEGPFANDIRRALCQLFFACLSRELALQFHVDMPKYTSLDFVDEKSLQHFLFARDVLSCIHIHHQEDIDFYEFSSHFLVSPGHMRRLLKETYKKSFQELLTEIRLIDARQMLLYTQLNITQIAEKCGFHSYDLFGKTFRKIMHMTPNEYRERNRTVKSTQEKPENTEIRPPESNEQ